MPEKLKPCPFCGYEAELRNSGFETCRNCENGDFATYWFARCPNCGTEQKGGRSEYRITNDEILWLMNENQDGRRKAIENWNRRVDNAKV